MVLEQDRVLALSRRAAAAGLRPGVRRGGAQMLMPDAVLLERDPAREAEALHALAMALLPGLDLRMASATGIPVFVADRPLDCVALGSGRCVEDFDALQRVMGKAETVR